MTTKEIWDRKREETLPVLQKHLARSWWSRDEVLGSGFHSPIACVRRAATTEDMAILAVELNGFLWLLEVRQCQQKTTLFLEASDSPQNPLKLLICYYIFDNLLQRNAYANLTSLCNWQWHGLLTQPIYIKVRAQWNIYGQIQES